MQEKELNIGEYYYYQGFEMEYIGRTEWNYLFRIKFIDDKIIQEMGSLSGIFRSKKEMMVAMYGDTIMKEIKELESLNIDRKDYKEKVIGELERISKEMSDSVVISSVLSGTDIRLATLVALKLKKWIDAYISKYTSNK